MTSFFIQNFGCRVNQAEAFDWAAEFQKRGWRLADDGTKCRVVIVNTCTLTARADRDGRKYIRKVVRDNPGARIVVTGCLAERDPEGLKSFPGIWRIVPNAAKASLPERCVAETGPDVYGAGEGPVSFRARALVKIQDGCDMACAFCVIPSVRGRSTSSPVVELLGRIERLISKGYAEIVLAGIHLCSYGRDLRPPSSLLWLLSEIERLPGDFRIRLSSLDPRLLPGPLLDLLTGSRRIAPHFHLSLQHGSDRVLRAMGRDSTNQSYRELCARLAGQAPEANIGADFIVGFPGETEKDFEATAALLVELPLGYAHVFSYSARPGTKAAAAPAVAAATVKARAGRLRRLSEKKNYAYRRRFVGRTLDGIVIQRKPGGVEILTPNYLEVLVPETGAREGAPVRVRINSVGERSTTGEICDNNGLRP
ncbi:MAG: tRNA (N(6)-L-threonylcarbamoyladenosine(37)-C(2))-methylthiotransferase MtaB [Candidatus Aminicenantes bacterium]|nr:tRNA (N(6)-L-threonylcarbamoyladenosine(37)-C(2))-methylthiotransferase MtaB [Candidatus Aminicenantes bacterium]